MEVELSILLLVTAAAAWAYLPFLPSVCELLELGDGEPVPVSPDSEVDIRHHAKRFRESVRARLAEPPAGTRADEQSTAGQLPDGTEYLVLRGGASTPPTLGRSEPCKTMLLATGALTLPDDGLFFVEIYAEGAIHCGDRGVYRALLSDDRLELGRDSRSLRWLDARHLVRAGAGSRLHGRVSAGETIELADGCEFERMRAPRIVFGHELDQSPPAAAAAPLDPSALGVPVEVAAGRWLLHKRAQFPANGRIEADIVVAAGAAVVGAGTDVRGSIKGQTDVVLGAGVTVEGSVVSGRDVFIEEGCHITGLVLAERYVWVGRGCRLGLPGRLTTLNARRLWIAPGTVVHGAVWAHEGGLVASEPPREVQR